jgi:hypothetical protein
MNALHADSGPIMQDQGLRKGVVLCTNRSADPIESAPFFIRTPTMGNKAGTRME